MSGERRSRRNYSNLTQDNITMDFKKLGEEISGLKTSLELKITNLTTLIEENINTTKLKLEAQDLKISELEADLNTQKIVNKKQAKQINELSELLDDTISHGRRLNLLIDGVPEVNKENTKQVVFDFLIKDMKLPRDDVEKYVYRDLHRLGSWVVKDDGCVYRKQTTGRQTTPPQPRTIIVAFTTQSDRNQVMASAKNLKDSVFSIKPDLSAAMSNVRNKLLTIRRDIKNINRRNTANLVYRSFKPKLIIKLDGQLVEYEDGMDINRCE